MQSNLEAALERSILPLGIFFGRSLLLEKVQTLDLKVLDSDEQVIGGCTSQTGECLQTLFVAAGIH